MPDFMIRTTTPPMPLDRVLNRLKNRSYIDLSEISDATPIDYAWASFSGDPKRLDNGDLFAALARPDLFGNVPEVAEKVRRHLGFRPEDPLQFKTLALSPTQQVAITIITPDHVYPDTPPLIFGAGLAHPSALYVPAMVEVARALQGTVILFDTPGNGSSQSSDTVNQQNFYSALKAVIAAEVPLDGQFYVGGHSLGSNAVYQLFADIRDGRNPVGRRELVRAMVVNPIPTRLQESSSAGRMSRRFMWGQVWSEVTHGLAAMEATTLDVFDNGASKDERAQSRALVTREEVPIAVPGMIRILNNQDGSDPSSSIGQDPRMAVVLSRGDRLMNWEVDLFDNRRGYVVLSGNHGGGLVGYSPNPHLAGALALVLNHGAGDEITPALEKEELYSRSSGVIRMGVGGTFQSPSTLFLPEIALRRGLATLGSTGLFVDAGISVEAGRQFGTDSRWQATPLAQIALGVEGLHLPISAKAGVQGGVDFLKDGENPLVAGWVAALGLNLARVVDIEAQARLTLGGEFQDVLAALKFQLN